MTREEYIYKASEIEEKDIEKAIHMVEQGYQAYPCDYELIFMRANYAYYKNQQEFAYIYYRLALSLCDNEDREIIRGNYQMIETKQLDAVKVRGILEQCIKERLCLEEYAGTYQFVTELTFSSDAFLFQEVIDQWVRYYYILLEIIACEKNHGGILIHPKAYVEWNDFEKLLLQYKFAIRRLWFDIPDSACELKKMIEKDAVSEDFLAVLTKYSVEEKYVAATMKKIASLLTEGTENTENNGGHLLLAYAEWYQRIHKEHLELYHFVRHKKNHTIHRLNMKELNEWNRGEQFPKDENKIAYILCVNDERYATEVEHYLSYQELPEGFAAEIIEVVNAHSMTQGYNCAMNYTDAKYKIYIHQDTFIFDPEYTGQIIQELKKETYQMLGVAGAERLPDHAVWWDCEPKEKKMCLYQDMILHILQSTTMEENEHCREVACLDGVLLATGRDLCWREDLFTHFHFYDISQSAEFRKMGYKIAVYNDPKNVGVLHEMSVGRKESSKKSYESARIRYLEEYS